MPVNPGCVGCMLHPPYFPDALFSGVGNINVRGPDQPLLLIEHNKGGRFRFNNCLSTAKASNFLQGINEKIKGGAKEKETSHKRMKWTDEMVKLLLTARSYIREDDAAVQHFPKPKKWKVVSSVMVQKGYHVTPHQCEDKFNDVNKKFRRLNVLLGQGTACEVVANPMLIESMDLSNEAVVEVMKILSSKQLFFQEMCSYHNGNRLFLPHDQTLQDLVKLVFNGKGKGSEEVKHEISGKRMRKDEDHGLAGVGSALDCNRRSGYHLLNDKQSNSISLPSKGGEGEILPNNWMASRLLYLKEQKLQEDLELEKRRLKNKVMKLENQRLAFELKCWKKGADCNSIMFVVIFPFVIAELSRFRQILKNE